MQRPVSPDLALDALLVRQEAELVRLQDQIAERRAALAVLVTEYAVRRPAASQEVLERLDDIDTIRDRLAQLARDARFELLSLMPRGAQSEASMAASKPLDEEMLKRGVDVRTVYLESVRNDPVTMAYARWLTELGGQVKTIAALPARMTIVDRNLALLPTDPDDTSRGAILVRGAGIVAAMCGLFDHIWAEAVPIGEVGKRREAGLSDQERELLSCLAQGGSDTAAARNLGISVRTVRRMIADLMQRLGARSRFQAGVRATEHGWIRPARSGHADGGDGSGDRAAEDATSCDEFTAAETE
ncbi:MAG TPA: helix-turn-helix transcriptional regulator [Streptosporangiaceae bacterium]|nr:helix-turn-helix transcriptional regulator [Streptosporangiaceae bacterium]